MFILAVIILGSFDQLLADPRPCTKDDYCSTVPVGACSDSLCQAVDLKQYAEFGSSGVRIITYNFIQKPLLRYCPLTFPVDLSEGYDGTTTMTNIVSLNSGPYCNITTATSDVSFTFKADQYTGLVTKMERELAGDKYEACFVYFNPGVGYVFRMCRVDPPPAYGEECATYQVLQASGVCNEDFQKYIDDLNTRVDFKQTEVDCS